MSPTASGSRWEYPEYSPCAVLVSALAGYISIHNWTYVSRCHAASRYFGLRVVGILVDLFYKPWWGDFFPPQRVLSNGDLSGWSDALLLSRLSYFKEASPTECAKFPSSARILFPLGWVGLFDEDRWIKTPGPNPKPRGSWCSVAKGTLRHRGRQRAISGNFKLQTPNIKTTTIKRLRPHHWVPICQVSSFVLIRLVNFVGTMFGV